MCTRVHTSRRVRRAAIASGYMDTLSTEARSRLMSRIKGRDTKPELLVRSTAHRLGLRFRLHDKRLAGKPDLVLPKHRTVIFVHGCFWHGHDCPRGARTPKANREYWTAKVARNAARDARTAAELTAAGWRVETIWECELKDEAALERRLTALLAPNPLTPAKAGAQAGSPPS